MEMQTCNLKKIRMNKNSNAKEKKRVPDRCDVQGCTSSYWANQMFEIDPDIG